MLTKFWFENLRQKLFARHVSKLKENIKMDIKIVL